MRTYGLHGALAAASLLLFVHPDSVASQDVFDLHELAPGIFAAEVVRNPPAYAFANSLVVIGEDGVLVVDTQQSPTAARSLIAAIRGLTDAPVRWVVNTHWHGDHVNGNQAYAEAYAGVEFIAHVSVADDMRTLGSARRATERIELPASIAALRVRLEHGVDAGGVPLTGEQRTAVERSLSLRDAYNTELPSIVPTEPTRTLTQQLDLTVGTHRVKLMHFGPAHTRGDIVVFLPDHGVAAVGDLLERGMPWFDDASPAGWLNAIEQISALQPAVILPSHGSVTRDALLIDDTRTLLQAAVAKSRADAEPTDEDPAGADPSDTARELQHLEQHWHDRYGVTAAAFRAGMRTAVARARLESESR